MVIPIKTLNPLIRGRRLSNEQLDLGKNDKEIKFIELRARGIHTSPSR
jgi:hypothetical protein